MNRTITAAMTTAALIIGAAVSSPAHAAEPKPTPFPRTNGIKEAIHVPVTALNPQVAV